MDATRLTALIGACTGVSSLAWNIYTNVTSGPKLRVTAFAGMVTMPPPPGNPAFLKITVQNVGTTTTTLTNAGFFIYESVWSKFRYRPLVMKFMYRTRLVKLLGKPKLRAAVLASFQGPQFPQKLEVGGEWQALMEQDGEFDSWLEAKGLYFAVWHSFSKNPKQVRIIQGPK